MPYFQSLLGKGLLSKAGLYDEDGLLDTKALAGALATELSSDEAARLIEHLSGFYAAESEETTEAFVAVESVVDGIAEIAEESVVDGIAVEVVREPSTAYDPTPGDLEDEIGELYDEVARLASASRPGTESRLDAAWAQLRALQAEEAREYRRAFEHSLEMPLDAGSKILAEAKALRDQLEGLTATDASAESTDPSAT